MSWKDGIVKRLNHGVAGLLAKAGTSVIEGRATLLDGKTAEITGSDGSTQRLTAEHVIVATGSEPIALPSIPFGGSVISSTEALSLTRVPDRLAVVGGGYIGLELGMAFAKLGADVTVVEAEDRILPIYDRQLTTPVARSLDTLGVTVLTSSRALGGRRRRSGGGRARRSTDRTCGQASWSRSGAGRTSAAPASNTSGSP